jgi:hypothetical protein
VGKSPEDNINSQQLITLGDADEHVRTLHRLAWRPGESMHCSWWAKLGLESWQQQYHLHARLRAPIDVMIVTRHGFPQGPLVTRLSPQQRALMALGARTEVVLMALGLLALNTADYLLMRCYRTQLVAFLGEQMCTRVLAAIPFGNAEATVVVDQIKYVALQAGVVTLDAELSECSVWQALRRTFPAYEGLPVEQQLRQFGAGQRSAINFAFRLGAICEPQG